MKVFSPLMVALGMSCAPASADQIVTLGDSLTFAYEAEFCFQQNITGFGPIGDGMPARVRNWIEILSSSNPGNRSTYFGLGARDSVTVSPPFDPPFNLYFRQSQNWAIPGLKIDGLRRFVTGDPTATFTSLIGGDFNTLGTIIGYSDFNNSTDFNRADLQNQIQNTSQRLTISIGGNDIKEIYPTIYNGGSAGTFVADFMDDMTAILNTIQGWNPNIQIVIVNVPHVGITPNVRQASPYAIINTERVSAVLRDLNGQLAALAKARNLGYADIYKETVAMIDDNRPLCIHGITFGNASTPNGDPDPVWLNGPISKNFHPNTSGQVVIANEVIHAFNKRYHTGIPFLTATEIHTSVAAKSPVATFDMPFATWMNRFRLNGLPASNDADGDGIPAGTEFALGLNPSVSDADKVSSGIVSGALEIAYPTRLPSTANYTLTPQSSTTLTGFANFPSVPAVAADGLIHARLTLGPTQQFIRLRATIP